jgi:hypothetical protein
MAKNRDQLLAELAAHGNRRRRARETAARELDAIERLLPSLLAQRVRKTQIAELGDISRPTLDSLLDRR